MNFKISVRIVPKNEPNKDSEPFVIELEEKKTRQLLCANWRETSCILTPFIPETHFLVSVSQIEPIA